MIHEVLLATDFSKSSEQATRVAVEYAVRAEARLHLLHVAHDGEPSGDVELARLADQLASPQLTIVMACVSGNAAEQILDYAHRAEIDLIVVGTHGRTGVSRALLGSVSERVARQAVCPVLTVPMSARGGTAAQREVPSIPPRCLVCSAPCADLVCMPCRARIRGEALDQKREQERGGHVPT